MTRLIFIHLTYDKPSCALNDILISDMDNQEPVRWSFNNRNRLYNMSFVCSWWCQIIAVCIGNSLSKTNSNFMCNVTISIFRVRPTEHPRAGLQIQICKSPYNVLRMIVDVVLNFSFTSPIKTLQYAWNVDNEFRLRYPKTGLTRFQ